MGQVEAAQQTTVGAVRPAQSAANGHLSKVSQQHYRQQQPPSAGRYASCGSSGKAMEMRPLSFTYSRAGPAPAQPPPKLVPEAWASGTGTEADATKDTCKRASRCYSRGRGAALMDRMTGHATLRPARSALLPTPAGILLQQVLMRRPPN